MKEQKGEDEGEDEWGDERGNEKEVEGEGEGENEGEMRRRRRGRRETWRAVLADNQFGPSEAKSVKKDNLTPKVTLLSQSCSY